MIVTAETAVLLIERIWSRPGMPFIAISTGKVRYCSTSTGERPGAVVSTETCVFVTSGTASTDSLRIDISANAKTAPQTASTTPRRRTDSATMAPRLIAAARS
jgi:hypothetical protein